MTTTEKVFEVGDKVRWRVDEECPYRCPECDRNGHYYDLLLSKEAVVTKVYRQVDAPKCSFCERDGKGEVLMPGGRGHRFFIKPIGGFADEHFTGGLFTADELELLP